MRKTFLLILVLCISMGAVSAKKRKKTEPLKPDTCAAVLADSVMNVHHFPMILVGKALSFPDSVSIRFLSSAGDSIPKDSSINIPGDKKELMDFFVRNIVYPNELKERKSEADLRLRMKLDKEGKVIESEVLNSNIPEMKQEVLRVAKLLPNILATDKKGQKTNTSVELPISFKILKL